MSNTHLCPRRDEVPAVFRKPEHDTWREDGSCSYCGSMNPDTLMERLRAGTVILEPTDKNYKLYVRNEGGEPFKQTYRSGCPQSPCPDIVDAEGKIDVEKCTHWVTREISTAKFYFQHLSQAQQHEFIDLLNAKRLKLDRPGFFYRLPFFIKVEEKP